MSLFHREHPVSDAESQPDRTWDVTDGRGETRRYATGDFDEFLTTTDEREMRRHTGVGWVLLDETVLPGAGPAHEELVTRAVTSGGWGGLSLRKVPVEVHGDLVEYLLGHPKPGVAGTVVRS